MKRVLLIAENNLWSRSVVAFSRVVSSRLYFSDRTRKYDAVLINSASMDDEAIKSLLNQYSQSHIFLIGPESLRERYKEYVLGCFLEQVPLRQIISAMSLALSPKGDEKEKVEEFLSTKEKLVLKFLIDGFSDREISREASLPISSVKYYLRNSYEKLGVRNRIQAALKLKNMPL